MTLWSKINQQEHQNLSFVLASPTLIAFKGSLRFRWKALELESSANDLDKAVGAESHSLARS
jgi:hypothetical protein